MSKKEAYIFEVSQKSFESAVIQNSHKIPVFVQFMGIWSEPCIQMSDVLAGLATEFAGDFIFAKVDVDEQPELMKQYEVVNVPTLKIIVNGEIIQTVEGQVKDEELRVILKAFGVYSKTDELRQQAREKHMQGDTLAAIQLLTEAMQSDPSNTKVAMDMSQIMIDMNELAQAVKLFHQLPEGAKSSDMGKSILGQLTFFELAEKTKGKEKLENDLQNNPDDCDAHFDLAVCLVAEKDFEEAMDHLFKIMELDEKYKDGAAREMIINVTNMLAANNPELSSRFRSRLSSITFT